MASIFHGGFFLTATELVGDSLLKWAANGGPQEAKVAGHVGYLVLSQVLYVLLKKHDLWKLNLMWDTTSNLATFLVGKFAFKEEATGKEMFGFALCLLGLSMIS
jgi:multidrug transporter EmrE-like cation transporter